MAITGTVITGTVTMGLDIMERPTTDIGVDRTGGGYIPIPTRIIGGLRPFSELMCGSIRVRRPDLCRDLTERVGPPVLAASRLSSRLLVADPHKPVWRPARR